MKGTITLRCRLLCAGLWLFATAFPAFAQSFPMTLPGQTAYGRLGPAGVPGPGQAIPFSVLVANLNAAQATGATANQIPVYPGGGFPAVSTSATTWFDAAYCNTVGWLIARTTSAWTCAQGIPINVEWFGAIPDGATDSTTAIQSAINSLTAGGILLIPRNGFVVSGTLTITNSIVVQCAKFSNNNLTSVNITANGGVTFLRANANGVTVRDCVINRTGTAADGIHVGDDYKTISDASITSSSANLNSPSQANFTSADIGKSVSVLGAGVGGAPLLATINSINSSTQAVLSTTASTTVSSGGTANYGNWYREFLLNNCEITDHATALLLQDIGQYHITRNWLYSTNPVTINNLTGQGLGASEFEGNTFYNTSNASYGVEMESGSDVRFVNNKFLGGIYNFYLNWNQTIESNLVIADNSFENYQTAGIFFTTSVGFSRVIISANSFLGTGGTAAVAILSGSTGARVVNNFRASAAPITNAGTNTIVVDTNGMPFASLPASLANGSQIFLSDGAPASSPCTGSSTGSTAFRQNGAWKCF
jgi:hypothetical protein